MMSTAAIIQQRGRLRFFRSDNGSVPAAAAPAFRVLHTQARSILSPTSGFIANAGFTHSLTPARNCTYACTYCYVPTMGIYGGLRPEDWRHWGEFTTYKENAAALLARELRPHQLIYCSPTVDPYQPAESSECMMPQLLESLLARPPRVFVLQTRGPLIVRDLALIQRLAAVTKVRVSFSLTTNREQVRRWFEPRCATFEERLATMRCLRAEGVDVYATLAPLLPCDPEEMAQAALRATGRDLIGDPFHVRAVKRHGATTRQAALKICGVRDFQEWLDPRFQASVIEQIRRIAEASGRRFGVGEEGFSWLART